MCVAHRHTAGSEAHQHEPKGQTNHRRPTTLVHTHRHRHWHWHRHNPPYTHTRMPHSSLSASAPPTMRTTRTRRYSRAHQTPPSGHRALHNPRAAHRTQHSPFHTHHTAPIAHGHRTPCRTAHVVQVGGGAEGGVSDTRTPRVGGVPFLSPLPPAQSSPHNAPHTEHSVGTHASHTTHEPHPTPYTGNTLTRHTAGSVHQTRCPASNNPGPTRTQPWTNQPQYELCT